MTTDLQTAIDISNHNTAGAKNNAIEMMANHLRHEHGWGIRRINLRLNMSDAAVKRACNE